MAILNRPLRSIATRRFKATTLIALATFALLLSDSMSLCAYAASKEYQVKAAFLFNFSQFVDWPAGAFANSQSQLVIGVLGEDPFGSYLDDLVRNEKIGSHPLAVQRFRRVEDVKTCHILFISNSEERQLDHILGHLKGRNILTVSDIDGFAQRGGVVGFITANNKIRFKINVNAGKNANLSISSKLLRVAEIVNS
jgi:hypothetical protein